MTKRAYGWTLAAVVGLLVIPATAGAVTYCVGSPGCTGTTQPDLQTALNAAAASTTVADTVQVGNPGAPPAGGYSYNDGGNAANQVDIVGAGRAQTVLTGTGPVGTVLVLIGPGSTVSHLTLQLPVGAPANTWYGIATSGTMRDVDIATLDPGTHDQVGVAFLGASGTTPKWLGGTLTLATGAGGQQGGIQSNVTGVAPVVEDVTITAQDNAVSAFEGTITLRRTTLASGIAAAGQGEHFILDNVAFRQVAGTPSGLGFIVQSSAAHDGLLDADHVSAAGMGGPTSYGMVVTSSTSGRSATANVRNSIFRGFGTTLYRTTSGASTVANANLSYTDIDLVHSQSLNSGGTGAINSGPGVIDENPHWVDALGGNFNVPGNSAVVDAGGPGAGVAAGQSATDVAGNPRVANGRTDMGALEFQPPIVSPPPPAPLPDTTAPLITIKGLKSKLTLKQLLKGVSLTLTPSEAASFDVTMAGAATRASVARTFNLVLAHNALPLAAGGRKVKLKPSRKLVGTARKFKVRVVIVATDRAGNARSITKTISIKR